MIKIPVADLMAALTEAETCLSNPGFCLECGEPAEDCEPDARAYECDCCGERAVYGAAEILLMGAFE